MQRDEAFFKSIKPQTNAYLGATIYQEIYNAAREAPAGSVIDIGPAQGGSTISLGLGRQDAGYIPRVDSLDVFRGKKNDVPRFRY